MSGAVLVLNATYEPLHTVSWKRAIVLVLDGDAEMIRHDENRFIRSATLTLAHPVVIRLLSFVRFGNRTTARVSRRGVLARDGYRCAYCSKRADTVDHLIPRSRPGGADTWTNMVAACRDCNGRKGNRTPDEANMPLRLRPYEPRGAAAIILTRIGIATRDEWFEWLEATAH